MIKKQCKFYERFSGKRGTAFVNFVSKPCVFLSMPGEMSH